MAGLPPRDAVSRAQAKRIRAQQVRRRRLVLLGVVVLLIVAIVLLIVRPGCEREGTSSTTSSRSTTSSTARGSTTTVPATNTAELTGAASVPPVDTASTGTLTLTIDPAESTISFILEVKGLTNTSAARIYQGQPETSGQAVATLFSGPTKTGAFSGVVAQGSIDPADLTGPLEGKGIGDLITLIQSGDAYVTVSNTSYPNGAIRGQIK